VRLCELLPRSVHSNCHERVGSADYDCFVPNGRCHFLRKPLLGRPSARPSLIRGWCRKLQRPRRSVSLVQCVKRTMLVAFAVVLASTAVAKPVSAQVGRGAGGCGGVGGGNTTGIGAALACGVPPPGGATPPDNGNGVLGASTGPLLGSQCIPTQQVPIGGDPSSPVPSHQYVDLNPAV